MAFSNSLNIPSLLCIGLKSSFDTSKEREIKFQNQKCESDKKVVTKTL